MKPAKALLFILFYIVAVWTYTGTASALDSYNYTEEEKIGFAFYRLGSINPDFNSWSKQTEEYQLLKPRLKMLYLQENLARLQQGFNEYYPEKDLINFTTQVTIKSLSLQTLNTTKDRYFLINSNIKGEQLLFPLTVGKEWVAVVPDKAEMFEKIYVTKEKYDSLQSKIPFSVRNTTGKAILNIKFRPNRVYTDSPILIEDFEMWLMSVEVADMSVWTKDKKELIWSYTAPWYNKRVSHSIRDIYEKQHVFTP